MERKKTGVNFAPLEKVFERVITPFEEFIHRQSTSGILLMISACLALIVANTGLYDSYKELLHVTLGVHAGDMVFEKSLQHWVNDGLMALFFFLVGLEIKREVLVGELSDPRHAILPVVAAVGGMVFPALIYFGFNYGEPAVNGWGIPMATDIAFAVGVMVLLGKRVPKTLITFLVALAIVDDLGAVTIIALFYTENLNLNMLGLSGLMLVVLILFNLFGIRTPMPYFMVGALLWLFMLKSGVHATLAGVLTALTIPARSKYDPVRFSECIKRLMERFDKNAYPGVSIMKNDEQRAILQTLENSVHLTESPLQRLEHNLHMPVAYLIIPIFAFFNAGIPIEFSALGDSLDNNVTLGVVAGLVIGKLLGVAGVSWVAVKMGIGELPAGTNFKHITGAALFAGIGFTMSIFISELAFASQPDSLLQAKTGVLAASLIAGIAGAAMLIWAARKGPEPGYVDDYRP